MPTLVIDTFGSFTACTFYDFKAMSQWLDEHFATPVAPGVWAIDDGWAAQTQEMLEDYLYSRV